MSEGAVSLWETERRRRAVSRMRGGVQDRFFNRTRNVTSTVSEVMRIQECVGSVQGFRHLICSRAKKYDLQSPVWFDFGVRCNPPLSNLKHGAKRTRTTAATAPHVAEIVQT